MKPPIVPDHVAASPQWKPLEAEQRQRDEREYEVAYRVLDAMASLHAGNPPTAQEFAAYCETLYQWTISEQWPPSNV